MALPKIDVPTYETKLISSGKKVKFRPFLVKEQKLFLMASQSNDVKETTEVVKQVLKNCILTDIEVDSLPTFDLEHLFTQLRARSVGEIVNLRYNCNNEVADEKGETKTCNGVVKFDFNLLELQPVIDPEHTSKIEISEKLGIIMKYPTFEMVTDTNIKNLDDIEGLLNLIVDCIDCIYDEDNMYYSKDLPREEFVEFVESMQQDDLEKIQKFFNTMPKFSKKVNFNCPKCGYKEEIQIEGLQNFFV